MKMTPADALMHQVKTRPKSAAFVFHEEVWTYERLAVEAESLARGLALRGVGPGDRVILHMMNRPEMIVAYYACFQLGAIAAPLRTAFKFAELAPILQRLKPALYLGEMSLYDNVAPVDAIRRYRQREFAGPARVIQAGCADHHIRDDRPAQIRRSYAGNAVGDDRPAYQQLGIVGRRCHD
jgi:acyl-CoA synthetase (AMP-forming)/AMP-acid ligase II